MEIEFQRRTRRSDSGIVPMINVVFLLMIFFLMSTTLTPEVSGGAEAPVSQGAESLQEMGEAVLVVDADGALAYGALRGDAALAALEQAAFDGSVGRLLIQAHRDVPGAVIARLMTDLGAAGIRESALVTAPGGSRDTTVDATAGRVAAPVTQEN
ncbi:MAG: biopolymer transporter ExbD [Pseudomonadota bacterium]